MKNVLMTITLGVFLTSSAFAAAESEFWFQPAAGNSALDVGLGYTSGTYKITGALNFDSKFTSMPLQLKYAYGLDTGMSVSVATDFGTDEVETSGVKTKNSGLSNLIGEFLVKSDSWYYGAEASVALAKRKDGSATSDGNRSTGGYSLTPFVGYKSELGLGGKLSYTYAMDRTTETTTTDETTSGGSAIGLEGFWESSYASGIFGAKIGYAQTDDSTTKQSGQADVKDKGYNTLTVGAFVAHDVTANGTILGSIDFVNIPESERTTGVKASYSATVLSAAYRMGF